MIRSPKDLFLSTETAKAHNDLVAGQAFQHATHTALAQMAMELPASINPDEQRDNSSRLAGARQFISILLKLGIPEQTRTKPKNDNLTHI